MVAIPRHLESVNMLNKRLHASFSRDSQWRDMLQDAYEYFLPQRDLFNEQAEGQKKTNRVFDSTAPESIQAGASKLQENIAPIWRKWAVFEPADEIIKYLEEAGENAEVSEEDVRKNLEEQADIVFGFINRSNFATQFNELALDMLIGTGALRIDEGEDEDNLLIFNTIPQNAVGYEEGPNGNIETVFRTFTVKAKNAPRLWAGFQPSAEFAETISKNPETEVKINEGVVFEPKEKVYYGVVWVAGEDRLSWVANFEDSSPWVAGRYAKVAGEVRGRGPALQVLADVRTINKVKEFVLQKTAIDVAGMWVGTDDGVFNPYTFTIAPGVVIPVASNNSTNPSIARLDTGTNLNLAMFEIEQLQGAIKRALFNDLRDPTGPVRSATEVAIEAQELAKRIGSAYGRLQTEVLVPILKRVVWILTRRGIIQPININGREVSIKFTSPLARAQDSLDLNAIQQAFEFTMATGGEAMVQMGFKIENLPAYVAKLTGMPQELVRSDAEKAQLAAEQQAQQQQMMEAEQGQPQQGQPNELG